MSDVHGIARDQLRAFVERVERIEAEIKDLNADKSDIYGEARAMGFDVKILKKVVAKRKIDSNQRDEEDLIFDMYWDAIHGSGLVHARTRENVEEFDAETGEVLDTVSDGSPAVPPSPAESEAEEISASNSPETATETQHPVSSTTDAHAQKGGDDSTVRVARTEAAAVTDRRDDHLDHQSEDGEFAAVNARDGLADANGVEPSSSDQCAAPEKDAAAGERHVEATVEQRSSAPEFNPMDTAGSSNGRAADFGSANAGSTPAPASTFKTARDFRPHCLKPEACAASGLSHCYACRKVMASEEEFA